MVNDTEGRRIYAIGDIHGCLDQLLQVQSNIQRDLAARPHLHPETVYVGDFTDRGLDSKGVIENLIAARDSDHHSIFILGNHDQFFLNYFDDPESKYITKLHWFNPRIGGAETLQSYGIEGADENQPTLVHTRFLASIPDSHRQFLTELQLCHHVGSYFFVHAGVRPEVRLDEQVKEDLVWIREPFLSSTSDHGATVVHGHSPSVLVENRGIRIGIDTGAVFNGVLSCLVLEGASQALLTNDGLVDCPPQA